MRFVHRDGAEAPLPEMPGALESGMDITGIAPVNHGQGAPQSVGVVGSQDKMHMVRHQNPCPNLDLGCPAMRGQQVAVNRIVIVAEECSIATVPTLRHVMRDAGDNETGEPSH